MSFSYVGSNSGSANGATTMVLTKPTGTAQGDLIIITLNAWASGVTITQPTGFTVPTNGSGSVNSNHYFSTSYLVAGASEPSSYTVSFSTSSTWAEGLIYVLRGAATSSPIANCYKATNATYSLTMPAASGTIANSSDATVYIYGGINSGASGSQTATMPGTLSNEVQTSFSSEGGVLAMGWGVDVTSPGSCSVTTYALDQMATLLDIKAASSAVAMPTPYVFTQTALRRSCDY